MRESVRAGKRRCWDGALMVVWNCPAGSGSRARLPEPIIGMHSSLYWTSLQQHSMSEANCLIVLDHHRGDIAAGAIVEAWPFDGLT